MAGDWNGFTSFVGEIEEGDHLGFVLAEDEAVKKYLTGLVVPNRTGTSKVEVWFRWPSSERQIKYPFITIDLLDIQPSFDRWTSQYYMKTSPSEGDAEYRHPVSNQLVRRGLYQPSTSPDVVEPVGYDDETHNLIIENYLMYTFLYQVTVHTREALHDRILLSRFLTDIFPPRPFWIGVDADTTWRRAELVQMVQADTMETTESGTKRNFRKVYTISMDAEIPQNRIAEIEKVLRVHIDLYGNNPIPTHEDIDHDFDDDHTIAEPINVIPEII